MLRQILLCLLLIVSSNILLLAQGKTANDNYHLLWKIEGNGLTEPSFIFGTMHVQDKRAFNYSDSVMLAIDRVDAFANEIHLDTMINQMFTKMFEKDTNNVVKNLLTDEEYRELSERVEKELGFPIDKINLSNPFFIESLLKKANSKDDKKDKDEMDTFVDAHLLGIAKTLKKNIYGLEKIEDQLSMFDNVSKEEKRSLLLKEIKPNEDIWESIVLENMVQIYEKGDIKLLEEFVGAKMINDPVLIKRNKIMVKSMLQIMEKESLFAAVGAAHIPGEQGVVRLLEEKGYKVTPVTATFTGVAETYKVDLSEMEWMPFQSEEFGAKLEAPGKMIDMNLFENLTFFAYPDLSTGAFYGLMIIPGAHQNVTEEYATTVLEGMKEKMQQAPSKMLEGEIIKTKQGVALETLIENKQGFQKIRYYVANNRVIALTVGNTMELAKSELADRFFESFEIIPSKADEPVISNWQKRINDKGALSVNLPFEPEYQVIDYPEEIDGKEYVTNLHIYVCTDTENMANYIYRYNDYPNGTYLEDEQQYFQLALIDLTMKADSIIGKVDTIFENGYEGREVNMTVQGYYSRARFFVRGNRIYYLVHQNINKNIQTIDSKVFLNTFQFEPYLQDTFKSQTFDDLNFKIDLPSFIDVTEDLEGFEYLPYKKATTITAKDAYTGAQYIHHAFEIDEYFQIESLDSCFNDLIQSTISYNDSILQEKSFYINDKVYGKEFTVQENTKKAPLIFRLVLHDKYLYETIFTGSTEKLDIANKQRFFDSFQLLNTETTANYGSKAKELLNNLSTNDTAVFNEATNAINHYYTFSKEEVPDVLKAINISYPLDTNDYSVRTKLFSSISDDLKEENIKELKEIYIANPDCKKLRNTMLPYFVFLDTINGYDTYFDLLINHSPQGKGLNLRYLYDSLSFTANKYATLVERFKDEEQHSEQLIDIGESLLLFKEGKYADIVNKEYENVTKNILKYLEDYKTSLEDTTNVYKNPSKIFTILRFMKVAEKKPMTDTFTNAILDITNPECSKWLKKEALCLRIQNDWKYDKKTCKKFLEDEDLTYDMLETLYTANQLNKSTKIYTERNAFVELAFNNYLEYSDDYGAEKIKVIDTVEKTDSLYYTVEFSYEDAEEKYIGIIGPFSQDKSKLNFDTTGNTSWEKKQENLKEQANELIEELIKWQKEDNENE